MRIWQKHGFQSEDTCCYLLSIADAVLWSTKVYCISLGFLSYLLVIHQQNPASDCKKHREKYVSSSFCYAAYKLGSSCMWLITSRLGTTPWLFVGGFVICFGSHIWQTLPPPCRQGFSWGLGDLLKSTSRFCFAQCKKCPRDWRVQLHYLINI